MHLVQWCPLHPHMRRIVRSSSRLVAVGLELGVAAGVWRWPKCKARPGAGVGAGAGAANRGFVDFSNRPHSPAGWIEGASVALHAPGVGWRPGVPSAGVTSMAPKPPRDPRYPKTSQDGLGQAMLGKDQGTRQIQDCNLTGGRGCTVCHTVSWLPRLAWFKQVPIRRLDRSINSTFRASQRFESASGQGSAGTTGTDETL